MENLLKILNGVSWEQWTLLFFAVMHIAEFIVRLTPTKKDDSILNAIKQWIDFFIPNLKKGGGVFKSVIAIAIVSMLSGCSVCYVTGGYSYENGTAKACVECDVKAAENGLKNVILKTR